MSNALPSRLAQVLSDGGFAVTAECGPPRGSDPREILIDLDGDIPDNPTEPEG